MSLRPRHSLRGWDCEVRISGWLRYVSDFHPTAVAAKQAAEQWARGVGRLRVGPQGRKKKEGEDDVGAA